MDLLYTLAVHDAPYVLWAYAIILLGIFGYLALIVLRMAKIDKEVKVLQKAADSLSKSKSKSRAEAVDKKEA